MRGLCLWLFFVCLFPIDAGAQESRHPSAQACAPGSPLRRAPRRSPASGEEKAQALEPPRQGRVERALLLLENRRFFERVLNPA